MIFKLPDTKEASKLLERATRLLNSEDGGSKLSLKQLLVGDSDSDTEQDSTPVASKSSKKSKEVRRSIDDEELEEDTKKEEVKSASKKKAGRPPISTASKTHPVKKPVKKPTPGTRRSSRNRGGPELTSESSEVDAIPKDVIKDEDKKEVVEAESDDDDQLVIDENPEPMEVSPSESTPTETSQVVPVKKGRGRPKRESVSKQEDKPEVGSEHEVKEEVKELVKEEVKEEIKQEIKEVEDVNEILKPKTRNQSGSR